MKKKLFLLPLLALPLISGCGNENKWVQLKSNQGLMVHCANNTYSYALSNFCLSVKYKAEKSGCLLNLYVETLSNQQKTTKYYYSGNNLTYRVIQEYYE